MPDSDIRGEVNRGLSWVGLASTAVSLLDFIAFVIILRYFASKEQYGIATLAWWMFAILDRATDLSAAIVQRDDHTDSKISTVFWVNLFMSTLAVGGVYLAGPAMTWFYGHAIVAQLMLAYSAKLVWQNFFFVPYALMRKELRYRELSIIRVFANLGEFTAKVGFAASGFPIWCWVLGPLCRHAITGIGVQICHPWRPRLLFRLRESWNYLVFGSKQAGAMLLFYIYTNIDYPIVGHFFGEAAVGVYRAAYEVVLEPVRVISEVVKEVAFPAFSRLKNSRDRLIEQFIAFTRLNLVAVIAFLAIVFVVVDELLVLLWAQEYLAAGPAIRILSAVGVLRALSYVVPPLLDGMGYPGRTLIYQTVATVALPTLFWVSATMLGDRFGFLSVAMAWAVGYPIAFSVLAAMGFAALELRFRDFLRRVVGIPICMGVAMAAGEGVRRLLIDLGPGLRFGMVTAVMLIIMGLLLAYTQGISLKSVSKAMKGQ